MFFVCISGRIFTIQYKTEVFPLKLKVQIITRVYAVNDFFLFCHSIYFVRFRVSTVYRVYIFFSPRLCSYVMQL